MPKPILIVVDDQPEMAEVVGFVAESVGFDVRIVGSGSAFQEVMAQCRPAVIVMDIFMPDMDGLELLIWLSKTGCTATLVLMSGYGDVYLSAAARLAAARSLTVAATLAKPIQVEDLSEILSRLVMSDPDLSAP